MRNMVWKVLRHLVWMGGRDGAQEDDSRKAVTIREGGGGGA
jgi:hypothetical protein